jgi:shikimate dehydrogenase
MVNIFIVRACVIRGNAGSDCLWHTLGMSGNDPKNKAESEESKVDPRMDNNPAENTEEPKEVGGRGGLDPTRYGDWEKAGRCIDF